MKCSEEGCAHQTDSWSPPFPTQLLTTYILRRVTNVFPAIYTATFDGFKVHTNITSICNCFQLKSYPAISEGSDCNLSLQVPGRLHYFSPHAFPDLPNLVSTFILMMKMMDCFENPPEEEMFGGIFIANCSCSHVLTLRLPILHKSIAHHTLGLVLRMSHKTCSFI